MRVLNWIVDRVAGHGQAVESPFGFSPRHQDINWEGLSFSASDFNGIMDINSENGREEAEAQKELFDRFSGQLPDAMENQRLAQLERFQEAPDIWRIEG